MRQAVVKKGGVQLEEVPVPLASEGNVLVRVSHSCISVGTEISGVAASRKSVISRVIENPANVKKVVNILAKNGLNRTISQVKQKLDVGQATGYSVSGVVSEVDKSETFFKVGDRVACAGAGLANHADYVSVPKNLVVKIPNEVDFESASTVTLGAIAMQGIRRANPTMGETFVVLGLGLLGQLTVQLLKANGCRVIGADLDEKRNQLASKLGADLILSPKSEDVKNAVFSFCSNYGADGVIITASSSDSNIISQAFQLCRKKGRVVLVGVVGLNLKREDFYKNEIDFLISSSYGPGRYDSNYEDKGLDYPISYVRWTENRNMQEYLRLIAEKKVDIAALIDGIFPISKVSEAYEALQQSSSKPLMILLNYDNIGKAIERKLSCSSYQVKSVLGKIGIGLIGAGSFAKGMHLPNLSKLRKFFDLRAVISATGLNAKNTASLFEANYCGTDYLELLHDERIDLVIITTRHNLHAKQALDCLKAGKHVLLEKPMALNQEELDQFKEFYTDGFDNKPSLTVGFNRRFSPLIFNVKEFLSRRKGPMIINYRMNAGFIDASHWVHGEEGGGRNIGEACHIYDLFLFLCESGVREVQASSISPLKEEYGKKNENFIATISFDDGSIATLTYTSLGSKKLSKEYMEIFFEGKSVVLDDYRSLSLFDGKHEKQLKKNIQDKGQLNELKEIAKYLTEGRGFVIPFEQQVAVTELSFEVEAMLQV